MPDLSDLLGSGSTAYQLFVWQVVGAFVGALLGPYITEAQKASNAIHQAGVLSPEQLASLVVRGHVGQADAQEQARLSGLPADAFDQLVRGTGNPPGPELLAEALRRGIIPEGSIGDTGASYLGGIAQGDLQNAWAEPLKRMALSTPSPSDAVLAAVRSMLDSGSARQQFEAFGGDPQYFDLLFNVTGEGPSPVEAGALANRGIIPWNGTGPGAVSFEQAVAESRFKNKWTPAYRALATYRPPPRTVTAMFREGSIDRATAIQFLKDYGVSDQAIPSYLVPAGGTSKTAAKALTESMVVSAYRDRATTKAVAESLLRELGYSQEDADFILATADAEAKLKVETATISVIHTLFTQGRIDQNTATTELDRAGVAPDQRTAYLHLWALEVKEKLRFLTAAEIGQAVKYGILTDSQAERRLVGLGYTEEDAKILTGIAEKGPL